MLISSGILKGHKKVVCMKSDMQILSFSLSGAEMYVQSVQLPRLDVMSLPVDCLFTVSNHKTSNLEVVQTVCETQSETQSQTF